MLGLTAIPYKPTVGGLKILVLLSQGFTQHQIAAKLKIKYATLRQRILRLKINIGANTIEQMMFAYGIYHEKQKAAP